MSETAAQRDYWTGEVELDKLELGQEDVREERPDHKIKEIGMDFEQRGQLQAAHCYIDPDDVDLDGRDYDECEMDWLVAQTDAVQVVDGWTRVKAAGLIGWPTLRCEVFRTSPGGGVMDSLAANMKRLEMRDYEIVDSLAQYQTETGVTQSELADRIGYSPSTVSKMFTALDGFPPAVEAWKSPNSHVEMGHVLGIEACEFQEDKQRVFNACINHERSVTQVRADADRASKETADAVDDDRSMQQRQADGESDAAQRAVEAAQRQEAQREMCLVCGQEATTKIALDVCSEDRGVLIRKRENNDPLMQPQGPAPDTPDAPPDDPRAQ